MADNYVTDPGAGGLTFASDEDVGGIHWPLFKLAWGPLDTFNVVEDAAGKRIPVDAVQSGAWSVSISGSVAVTGPLTDAQLRAVAVPVSGTFFQATQPVSIAATVTVDSELPAAAALADNTGNPTAPAVGAFLMAWDGTNWDRVQTGAAAGGALKVDGSAVTQPVSGPLTDAQLRATPVPVSGTVDLGATDNAVLDAIAASVAAIDTDTSTIIGHVDGLEGLLGTIDTDTGGILTAVQLLDDAVQVLGTDTYTEATSKGITLGAVRRDADTSLVNTTNEFAPLQVDALGRLKVEAFSGETLPVSLATLPALVAGSANIGDVDVLTVPADPFGVNADAASATGSISAKLRFIAATGIPITALPASTNTLEVVGDAAHDAAIAGNPVRIAGRGMSADYTAVATGETADLLSSLLGKQVVMPYALPAASESYASPAAVTDTADDEAFAAAAAGIRHYITGVQVFNGHDTVGTEVVIKDGSTVKWRGWAEQTGGGCSARFDPPLRMTAATAVNVANITTGSSTYFNLQGYTASE